jgi:GDP-L-fucose synthase
MAGSAICRALRRNAIGVEGSGGDGQGAILTAGRDALDLLDTAAVNPWMERHKPDVVVLAAAKVGGILASSSYPVDFLLENIKIQCNVIEAAWRCGVHRLLFLGSSCIYPKQAERPIREEALLSGPLEPTNAWYALAKISGIKVCAALRQQYGFDSISLMPTNLYGPGDIYHPTNSHVLPAMIRRFHGAVEAGSTGTPLREFLHVDDLGEACVFALQHWDPAGCHAPCDASGAPLTHLNVGTGVDLTISELAQAVAEAVGFKGDVVWDTSKPDGTAKKQLDAGTGVASKDPSGGSPNHHSQGFSAAAGNRRGEALADDDPCDGWSGIHWFPHGASTPAAEHGCCGARQPGVWARRLR